MIDPPLAEKKQGKVYLPYFPSSKMWAGKPKNGHGIIEKETCITKKLRVNRSFFVT